MGVQTPESKVKQFIRKYMTTTFPGIYYYSPMGGAFGKAGFPDHMYVWKGVLVVIEAKAENGRATELQMQTLRQLANQGAIAAIVVGKDSGKMDRIRDAVLAELKKRGVEL
jgi:hypothetical protein